MFINNGYETNTSARLTAHATNEYNGSTRQPPIHDLDSNQKRFNFESNRSIHLQSTNGGKADS
jgi:hypothetical protein